MKLEEALELSSSNKALLRDNPTARTGWCYKVFVPPPGSKLAGSRGLERVKLGKMLFAKNKEEPIWHTFTGKNLNPGKEKRILASEDWEPLDPLPPLQQLAAQASDE